MKIDFYVLENASKQQAMLFACRLIEKKYSENLAVYTHFSTQEEANKFDQLLWTFREDSFVPHQLSAENARGFSTIEIGYLKPVIAADITINFSNQLPDWHQQTKHLLEIVYTDETVQQLARQRFRHYRELGYELNTQKLKVNSL